MILSKVTLRGIAALLVAAVIGGCAAAGTQESSGEEGGETVESNLTSAQRADRAAHLRDVAASRGLENGWMLAGIANAETNLAHCWSELSWACKGPASADCGGGPVVAGAGDGACSKKQGGLGMFQFDAGTHSQTIAKYGNGVLTLDGNINQAVTFIINMVIGSKYIPNVSTEEQALDWMNGITVGSADYKIWIKTVTHYYNGCVPGSCSVYNSRYKHYDELTRGIYNEMGADFWKPSLPMELGWERAQDGHYDLWAQGPIEVTKVRYLVEDYLIAEATRDDPTTQAVEDNFPDKYSFKYEVPERFFEVIGYDKKGARIARGIGLIDSIPGTAAFIRQMGDHEYEIGLERASDQVSGIEVRVDGILLTDAETGLSLSPRNAVRYTFNTLGERSFDVTMVDATGKTLGHLKRDFRLE